MNEQKLLEIILFNRGMIVGLQETMLTVIKNSLSRVEIEKVVKELESSPAIIDAAAKEILDKGSILFPAYHRGFEAGHEYFLEQLTRLKSSSD